MRDLQMAVLSPDGQAALRTILHDPSQVAVAPRPILVEIARGWLAHRRLIGVHDSEKEGSKPKKARRPIAIKDIPQDILIMILELAMDKNFTHLKKVTQEFYALTKEVVRERLTTCAASLDELFEDTRLRGMGPHAIFACRYKRRSKLEDLKADEKNEKRGTMDVLNKNAALDIHPEMYNFLDTFCAERATWITSKLDSTRWDAVKKQLDVLPKWLISTENMEIQKADINRSMIVAPIFVRKNGNISTGALFWVRLIDASQNCSLDMLMQTAHDPRYPPIKKLQENLVAYHTDGFDELVEPTGFYPRAVGLHLHSRFITGSEDVHFYMETWEDPTPFGDANYRFAKVAYHFQVNRVPFTLSERLALTTEDGHGEQIEAFFFLRKFYHNKKYIGQWAGAELAIKNIQRSGDPPTEIQGSPCSRYAHMRPAGYGGRLSPFVLQADLNEPEKIEMLSNIQDLIVFKFDVKKN